MHSIQISMATSSASLPFLSFSPVPPKCQLPSITLLSSSSFPSSNSPLKYTPLCMRIKTRAKYGSRISGHLKRVAAAGDYGGFLGNQGGISASMCSTTPFIGFGGRVGLQKREGNVSLLSFGVDTNQISGDESKGDSSQILSAMLPFVVAATALSQPSTFTWVSKDLYAPALGGIMLYIGIRLSINDFALVFQRPLPLSIGFIAQYVLKPVLGVLIAQAFGMPKMFCAGFVLTACVAGAQLSSYASFLSKGLLFLSMLLPCRSQYCRLMFSSGGSCTSQPWPIAKYLCQISCQSSSSCDAICSYDLYFIVHRQSSCNKPWSDSFSQRSSIDWPSVDISCSSFHSRVLVLKASHDEAGRRSLQDNFVVHRNAELDTSWASRYPVSRVHSTCFPCMFSGCNGYHGPQSRLFLG